VRSCNGINDSSIHVGPKVFVAYQRSPFALSHKRQKLANATVVVLLINPVNAGSTLEDMQAAAGALGLRLRVLRASTDQDIDAAFATLAQERADALVISPNPFFTSKSGELAALALSHALPAIYQYREFAIAGGLMSYGSDLAEAYRLSGIYTGRILKGDKPADLPVQRATKVELLINMKTAKALGITFPLTLLGRADEVIE